MTALPSAAPSDVDLDRVQLERADAHVARYVERGILPGAFLLVARGGRIAHASAFGLRDRERNRPFARDSIVRIYSMTKPITSVALMMLHEEGHFQLDDPLERYIPAFRGARVFTSGFLETFETEPARRPITIRDLLSHQAGLTYGFQNRTNVDAAYRKLKVDGFSGTLAEWVEIIARLPLEFHPGEAWNYSVATDVCGRLVEVFSGRSLDQFFRERIFAPLGMADTDFFVPAEKLERFAACYQKGPDGATLLQDDPVSSSYRSRPRFLSGGGGLVSTVDDYARFALMLAGGGTGAGQRLLGRKTLALMASNHLPGTSDLHERSVALFSETSYKGVGFGLGFSVTLDPAAGQIAGTVGEFAWGGAASTYFWVDPAEDLVVVFMTQYLPSRALNIRRELRSLVYAAL